MRGKKATKPERDRVSPGREKIKDLAHPRQEIGPAKGCSRGKTNASLAGRLCKDKSPEKVQKRAMVKGQGGYLHDSRRTAVRQGHRALILRLRLEISNGADD
jgi:hypothetical protein